MKKFLEEFYQGNINPAEKKFNETGKYAMLLEEKQESMVELEKGLNVEQTALLQNIIKCSKELSYLESLADFKIGMKYGVLLWKELSESDDEIQQVYDI